MGVNRTNESHRERHTSPTPAAIFRSELEKGTVPKVFEDGGQMRDFIHVDDIAGANLAGVESDAGGFAAYNVCSGRPISILEDAGELCAARGEAAPAVTGEYRSGDVRHIALKAHHASAFIF